MNGPPPGDKTQHTRPLPQQRSAPRSSQEWRSAAVLRRAQWHRSTVQRSGIADRAAQRSGIATPCTAQRGGVQRSAAERRDSPCARAAQRSAGGHRREGKRLVLVLVGRACVGWALVEVVVVRHAPVIVTIMMATGHPKAPVTRRPRPGLAAASACTPASRHMAPSVCQATGAAQTEPPRVPRPCASTIAEGMRSSRTPVLGLFGALWILWLLGLAGLACAPWGTRAGRFPRPEQRTELSKVHTVANSLYVPGAAACVRARCGRASGSAGRCAALRERRRAEEAVSSRVEPWA